MKRFSAALAVLFLSLILLPGCKGGGGSSITHNGSQPLITDGLVAYYPFDGNANAVGGTGKDGVTSGQAAWGTDRFGNSDKTLQLNGTDAFVTVQEAPFSGNENTITIACWVKTTTDHGLARFVWWGASSGSIAIASYADKLNVSISNPGTDSVTTVNSFTGDTWVHFAVTYDGATVKAYINGIADANTLNKSATLILDKQNLLIGRFNTVYWEGALDDFYIFNRILTDDEIKLLADEK